MNIRIVYFTVFFFNALSICDIFARTVYIIPFATGVTYEQFFNFNDRDGCSLPFIALKDALIAQGYKCTLLPKNSNDIDEECWFIAFNMPADLQSYAILRNFPKERAIALLFEPPSVFPHNYNSTLHSFFKKILTLFHETVDNVLYYPFYFPQPFLSVTHELVPFNEKKLCTLIACDKFSNHPHELYSQRQKIISFFEHSAREKFDLYGMGWNSNNHPCYKGTVANKLPYLRHYKFAICYENMISQTYLTEKIFDTLHAGCIPVYWGAQEIVNYIPYRCYILREDFASDEELYNFLNTMPEDEYNTYLTAAKEFFKSPYAQKFSITSFVNNILKVLF